MKVAEVRAAGQQFSQHERRPALGEDFGALRDRTKLTVTPHRCPPVLCTTDDSKSFPSSTDFRLDEQSADVTFYRTRVAGPIGRGRTNFVIKGARWKRVVVFSFQSPCSASPARRIAMSRWHWGMPLLSSLYRQRRQRDVRTPPTRLIPHPVAGHRVM